MGRVKQRDGIDPIGYWAIQVWMAAGVFAASQGAYGQEWLDEAMKQFQLHAKPFVDKWLNYHLEELAKLDGFAYVKGCALSADEGWIWELFLRGLKSGDPKWLYEPAKAKGWTWLQTILDRKLIDGRRSADVRRRKENGAEVFDEALVDQAALDPERAVMDEEEVERAYREALHRASPKERKALTELYLQWREWKSLKGGEDFLTAREL